MRPHLDNKKGPQDVDDSSDTYDTIEFLLKHVENNNGKVGIWGFRIRASTRRRRSSTRIRRS